MAIGDVVSDPATLEETREATKAVYHQGQEHVKRDAEAMANVFDVKEAEPRSEPQAKATLVPAKSSDAVEHAEGLASYQEDQSPRLPTHGHLHDQNRGSDTSEFADWIEIGTLRLSPPDIPTDAVSRTTSGEDADSAIDDACDGVALAAGTGGPVLGLVQLTDSRHVKSVVAPVAEDLLVKLSADQGGDLQSIPHRYLPRGPLTKPTDSQATANKPKSVKKSKGTKTPPPSPSKPPKAGTK
ncbi:hypothetical protein EW145_g179 [Phellinidium pouzarii]|uniref:Uncharacterized protein n=1 Tax=Phellinidium pouzarii TaxID=167371 RepID=A0A4S4LJD9_9AGAM|nr:hypothetical protein EW145_g179 [Phellinidium pouzarii]